MASTDFGKLESTHGIAPAFMQRAVIVAALSFLFFLGMMLGFYVRQNIGYFLLASAFLLVYILTMFGWLVMRKYNVKIYENGIVYKKFEALWNEIEKVETRTSGTKINFEIRKKGGETINLSEAIDGIRHIIERVNEKVN